MPPIMDEFMRQASEFQVGPHKDKRIDIAGCGSVGSYLAWTLTHIGFQNLHVWDKDVVADHNLPNQCFRVDQIGQKKVVALRDMIFGCTGLENVTIHDQWIEGPEEFGPFVFLAVDSMKTRKEIWDHSLKDNIRVELVIETRMGGDIGRIYTVKPFQPSHVAGWEKTLYSDEEAETSACGASISVAPTVMLTAAWAVWQLMRHLNGVDVETTLVFGTNNPVLYTSKFSCVGS